MGSGLALLPAARRSLAQGHPRGRRALQRRPAPRAPRRHQERDRQPTPTTRSATGRATTPRVAFRIGVVLRGCRAARSGGRAFVDSRTSIRARRRRSRRSSRRRGAHERRAGQRAGRAAQKAVALYRKGTTSAPAGPAAHARYLEGEVVFRDFERVKLASDSKRLKRTLDEKSALMEKAKAAYVDVVTFGDPEWATAALYRIGDAYERFAKALRGAPVPTSLSAEEQQVYRDELEKVVVVVEEKAIDAYKGGYQKALQPRGLQRVHPEAKASARPTRRSGVPGRGRGARAARRPPSRAATCRSSGGGAMRRVREMALAELSDVRSMALGCSGVLAGCAGARRAATFPSWRRPSPRRSTRSRMRRARCASDRPTTNARSSGSRRPTISTTSCGRPGSTKAGSHRAQAAGGGDLVAREGARDSIPPTRPRHPRSAKPTPRWQARGGGAHLQELARRAGAKAGPDAEPVRVALGAALRRAKKLDDALDVLRAALRATPRSPAALNQLGLVYQAKGQLELADLGAAPRPRDR